MSSRILKQKSKETSIEQSANDPEIGDDPKARGEAFRDNGLDPEEAAKIILQGVRDERWRILVGTDAQALDEAVRDAPEDAYEREFMETRVAPVLSSLLPPAD